MHRLPRVIAYSLLRSRLRASVFLSVVEAERGSAADLARMTGIRRERVVAALVGHARDYRSDLGLVGLGLAERVPGVTGFEYAITPLGRRVAPLFRRRLARAAGRGRFERELVRARWARPTEGAEASDEEAAGSPMGER